MRIQMPAMNRDPNALPRPLPVQSGTGTPQGGPVQAPQTPGTALNPMLDAKRAQRKAQYDSMMSKPGFTNPNITRAQEHEEWKKANAHRFVSPTGFAEDSPDQLEAQRNFYQRVSGSSPTDEELLAKNAEKRQPGYAERQAAREKEGQEHMAKIWARQKAQFADTPENAARKAAYQKAGLVWGPAQKADDQQRQIELDEQYGFMHR